MDVCLLSHDGEIRLHRTMKAAPEPFRKAIAPYHQGLGVAVECRFTWSWLADLCAQEGIAFVLGHALARQAIPGGNAKPDTLAAHKMAHRLRGGMPPHAGRRGVGTAPKVALTAGMRQLGTMRHAPLHHGTSGQDTAAAHA
jgi:hypothetical protein